jgi:hypothetical protein
MSRLPQQIRCREIGVADLDAIVDLLTTGYQISNRDFWLRRIKRLSAYAPPLEFPKYGFILECDDAPVGVIFTIFSSYIVDEAEKIRCHLAYWYVAPAYRSYAPMLARRALRNSDVTYVIGTPIDHVLPVLKAQGYVQFCNGRFVAAPMLARRSERARVELVASNFRADGDIRPWEAELLSRHAGYGCISLTCNAANGRHPFVFHPRLKAGVAPFARLVYCRDFADFVRFAAPLGRFLASRGYPLVVLDADGPIRGLIGKYSDKYPKYFKGPDRPRLGDSAYSSRVIFDY